MITSEALDYSIQKPTYVKVNKTLDKEGSETI